MSDFRRSARRWARRVVARGGGDEGGTAPVAVARRSARTEARQRRRVRRLRAAVLDLSGAVTGLQAPQVPSASKLGALTKRARLQRERARFVTELAAGRTWGEALLTTAAGLLANGRPSEVVALALRLETSGVTDREVPVAMALAADHQDHPRLVRSELHRTDPATVAARAARAAVRAGVLTGDDDLVDTVLHRLPLVPTDDLVAVACMLRSSGRAPQAEVAAAELTARWADGSPDARAARVTQWLVPRRAEGQPAREPAAGVLASFGPLPAGRQEGRQAMGLGTVASLALLERAGLDGVHLVPRDHTSWPALPDRLWTVAAGRFPTSPFDVRPEFPFASSLEPLFLGFSVVGAPELDDPSVAYLRSKEPIGCSDVASVLILCKAGVKAFYSGRIESTLAETMPSLSRLDPAAVRGAGSAERDHLARAIDEVTALADGTGRIRTSTVATLVAARALGRPVAFVGQRPGHARLDGPVHRREGVPPEPELALRMVESVVEAFRAVAAGEPPDAVRAAWARCWAADVRAAEELWQQPSVGPPLTDAPLEAAARIRSAGRHYGPRLTDPDAVEVSLATDQNLVDQLPVTLEGIVRNTSRPLRISILTRGVGTDVERRLAAAHPGVGLSFFPCDTVDHGGRLIKHITASTMDRLLLPEILDGAARTVYIDIDALVLDDIGQLFDWDLAGAPVAARASERSVQSIAVNVSSSLEPDLARELRDTVLPRAGHHLQGINAGVLVLDLERMRGDDFCRTYVPWVSRFHLNDQEVLEFYAGDELSVLPERWNAWPYKETVDDPAVLHWVGPFKPWRPTVTREQRRWAHYASLADERRAAAPAPALPSARDH